MRSLESLTIAPREQVPTNTLLPLLKSPPTLTIPPYMKPPKTMIPSTLKSMGAIALVSHVSAQTELTSQSSARPFGLDIAAPVYQAGSDSASASFQDNDLPVLRDYLDDALGERETLNDVSSIALDPSKLKLNTTSDVRVYFIGEGAGYHNTLGINTDGVGTNVGNPQLVFPDASSRNSSFANGDKTMGLRTNSLPLLPGDFVDVGSFGGGTQLDFFLIANGANGGSYVYTAHEDANPDGIQHTVSFAIEGSPYLLIGFEDLYGGGDRDFNDILFAVDIGAHNVAHLANPEPSTMLILFSFLGFIGWSKAKANKKNHAHAIIGNGSNEQTIS